MIFDGRFQFFTLATVRTAVAAMLCAAAAAGCSSEKEAVSIDRSLAYSDIMEMVNKQAAQVNTFSAEGSISIDSPRMAQTVGFRIDVKKPDSMKIIISGPFGITVGEAIVTKENYVAYSTLQNTLYKGSISSHGGFMNMINVPTALLVDAMSGERRFDDIETRPDSFYVAQSHYVVKFFSPAGWNIYTVDPISGHIIGMERISGSTLQWKEEYSYEEDADKQWRPSGATIILPEKKTRIDIEYSSVEYNRPIPSLSIAFPNDADQVTIE